MAGQEPDDYIKKSPRPNLKTRIPTLTRERLGCVRVRTPVIRDAGVDFGFWSREVGVGRSVVVSPAFPGGATGNLVALLRRENGGTGGTALQSAEPAERGGVGIQRYGFRTPRENLDAFGWSVTARAGEADRVGGLGLLHFVDRVTDEASPPHGDHRVDLPA
jgi:hypothetical protein